jgi:hypothetical protein
LNKYFFNFSRKTELINAFRNFNDYAEANETELKDNFFQEFGWTGVQINLIDNALKHITARFRLRGLNNYSNQTSPSALN